MIVSFFLWCVIAVGLLAALLMVLWLLAILATALEWVWQDVVVPAFDLGGRS